MSGPVEYRSAERLSSSDQALAGMVLCGAVDLSTLKVTFRDPKYGCEVEMFGSLPPKLLSPYLRSSVGSQALPAMVSETGTEL